MIASMHFSTKNMSSSTLLDYDNHRQLNIHGLVCSTGHHMLSKDLEKGKQWKASLNNSLSG